MYSPVEVYRIAKIGIEKSWRSIVGYVIRYAFAFGTPYLFGSTCMARWSGVLGLVSPFGVPCGPDIDVQPFGREEGLLSREGRSFLEHQLGKSCSFHVKDVVAIAALLSNNFDA